MHLHPQHVLLVDMLGAPIRFTTLDHQFYLGSAGPGAVPPVGVARRSPMPRPRPPATTTRSSWPTTAARRWATRVSMALRRALNLEEAATMTYRLLLAGDRPPTSRAEWKGNIVSV